MAAPGVLGARVVGIDGFGNVQLNVTPADLDAAGLRGPITVGPRSVPRAGTFADVPHGQVAAIVDSQGFLALVVNHGSAAQILGLKVGDPVVLGA
jgi:S-adenosylmethionine hydrolase